MIIVSRQVQYAGRNYLKVLCLTEAEREEVYLAAAELVQTCPPLAEPVE